MPVKEATIYISGHKLSFQESMTLRVAISNFLMSLKETGLGDDEHGKIMTEQYIKHAGTIQRYIMETAR